MMTSVPSTPVSYSGGAMPLRILNKGPEYFRNSKRSGSGSENRRKTAAERLEADKFKYVKSEEVRQRRFTLELRTSSPPNNDSTGAQSMGTASTGSPTNMEEDDTMAGNDVIVDFSTEEIIQEMANFTRYKEIKNATPVLPKKQHRRPSSEHLIKSEAQADNSAEILHSMTASRRQQRMKNKALRNVEKNKNSSTNMSDNVTPPSPLITRLRETLHGTSSTQANTGNASTPSPVAGATAEIGTQQEIIKIVTSKTDSVNKEIDTKHSYVSKSNSTGNSLNNYLNKAKEGIKNVASLRAIVGLEKECTSREQSKERQSRSNAANSGRRYRSASAGPNVYKPLQNNNPRMESSDFSCNNHLSVAGSEPGSNANPMSPRSQLKHVRQNLKKVKIDTGRTYHRKHTNSETSIPSEYTSGLRKTGGSTFTVDPSLARKNRNVAKRDQPNMSNQVTSSEKGETRVESKPPLMPRPRNDGIVNRQERPTENLKKRTKSTEGMDTEESASSNSRVNQVKRANSNRVKRRSWDILHSTENNMQSLSSKSSGEEDVLLTSGVTKSNNTQSTTRHRRPHSYSSEQRKSNLSSRMSLPEDAMQSFKDSNSHLLNKTGSRKSVAEALEEIINPILTDDELKNRNSAASPDIGSTGENTLVENRESFYGNLSTAATFGTGSITSRDATKNSSVADNINSALGGIIDEKVSDSETSDQLMTKKSKVPMKSKTVDSSPPYTRSRAMASRQLKEKESSSTELLDSSGQFVKSSNKPPSFFDGPNNSAHLRPVPMRQHSAPTGLANSHPISKLDWQTQYNSGTDDGQLTQSPKLAPKSRREVEPDHVRRRSQTHRPEDTMKSQQTSSSASGDASKPFTALTASDLKPRSNRNLRNVVPQSAPVKPTFAFPGQPVPQTRHNPKRHTTTPISPTLSPNKQAARMTPPQTPTRSCSSTPYSSLKRTPTSSRSSSLKRNRHRSKSDVLPHQHELDRFFSSMGMEDHKSMAHHSSINDTMHSNHLSSESDFSFAGASAYVRDSPDEAMDVDPTSRQLLRGPQSVSIIEKNARVMRWLMSCQKNRKQSTVTKPAPHTDSEFVTSQSPPVSPTSAREPMKPSHQLLSTYPPQNGHHSGPSHPTPIMRQNSQPNTYSPPVNSYPSSPPPIPPRTYQRQQGMYAATHNDATIVGAPKESNV